MSTPAVEFRAIEMRFGEKIAVTGINLTVEKGAYVVLLGPSGGGKTTLLNMVGGFLEPTAGEVLIDGQDMTHIPPAKRPTATVFQDYALFPHMSVASNVAFGLKMHRVPEPARSQKATAALDMVGLGHLADRRIHELSGGQRQRIALARALAVEPTVLLLDEPLGALDMKLRRQMQDELKTIQKRTGTTFVHVTHDQEEAMAIADTIVVMNNGFIDDMGPPERIYLRPATRFTADFMGESNFLPGTIQALGDKGLSVQTALGCYTVAGEGLVGETITLSMRPEHLSTDGQGVPIAEATVLEAGFFGTHHQCTASVEGIETPFKVRLSQKDILSRGDRLSLSIDPSDFVVLRR